MSLSLSAIFDFYHEDRQVFCKAEKLFKGGNLYEFKLEGTCFSAKILASMKAVSYDPKVSNECYFIICCTTVFAEYNYIHHIHYILNIIISSLHLHWEISQIFDYYRYALKVELLGNIPVLVREA
jgi:hypothetical protein